MPEESPARLEILSYRVEDAKQADLRVTFFKSLGATTLATKPMSMARHGDSRADSAA